MHARDDDGRSQWVESIDSTWRSPRPAGPPPVPSKVRSEETPRTYFAHRSIGRRAPGYEASFPVLEGNPMVEFSQTQAIRLRLMQGVLLDVRDGA
jgi:hypothetical protein